MLINLTQQGTRCSNSPGEARKQLISGSSSIEAKAELIHVALQMNTSAMIGAQQKGFEITDCCMKPMQITNFVGAIVDFNILQAMVALIPIALHFGLLCKVIAATALALSVPRPRFPSWEGPPTK